MAECAACLGEIRALRAGLGLFANLRPVRVFSSLENASTLKPEVVAEKPTISGFVASTISAFSSMLFGA